MDRRRGRHRYLYYALIRLTWRRGWDSNPRYGFPYTRFPSVRLKPLGHLSGPEKSRGQYSGRVSGYNPRGSRAVEVRDINGRSSIATLAAPAFATTEHSAISSAKAPRPTARGGTIPCAFRYHGRLERGEAGGRHGSWAIVMAPRHSDPCHYFDMGAWRPARLILPSGSSVVSAY
jgi:hypothetical protein